MLHGAESLLRPLCGMFAGTMLSVARTPTEGFCDGTAMPGRLGCRALGYHAGCEGMALGRTGMALGRAGMALGCAGIGCKGLGLRWHRLQRSRAALAGSQTQPRGLKRAATHRCARNVPMRGRPSLPLATLALTVQTLDVK